MYSSYNYGNPGYAYPDYFSYYIMEIDEQTQLPDHQGSFQSIHQGLLGIHLFLLQVACRQLENSICLYYKSFA